MQKSAWGTNPQREVVLAIWVKRSFFESCLAAAVCSDTYGAPSPASSVAGMSPRGNSPTRRPSASEYNNNNISPSRFRRVSASSMPSYAPSHESDESSLTVSTSPDQPQLSPSASLIPLWVKEAFASDDEGQPGGSLPSPPPPPPPPMEPEMSAISEPPILSWTEATFAPPGGGGRKRAGGDGVGKKNVDRSPEWIEDEEDKDHDEREGRGRAVSSAAAMSGTAAAAAAATKRFCSQSPARNERAGNERRGRQGRARARSRSQPRSHRSTSRLRNLVSGVRLHWEPERLPSGEKVCGLCKTNLRELCAWRELWGSGNCRRDFFFRLQGVFLFRCIARCSNGPTHRPTVQCQGRAAVARNRTVGQTNTRTRVSCFATLPGAPFFTHGVPHLFSLSSCPPRHLPPLSNPLRMPEMGW